MKGHCYREAENSTKCLKKGRKKILREEFQQPQNIEKGKRNNNLFYTYRYTAPTLHSKKYSQFFINCYSNLLLKWPETTKNLSSGQLRLRNTGCTLSLSFMHDICLIQNPRCLYSVQRVYPCQILVATKSFSGLKLTNIKPTCGGSGSEDGSEGLESLCWIRI